MAQGVEIIASPFKTITTKEDESRTIKLRDIKGIQQQNNFTNQILGTISSQLNIIEKIIPNNNNKTKETEKEKEKPLFQPSKNLRLGGNKSNDDLVKILTQKLAFMEIKNPSSSKDQINFLSGSETCSYVSETFTKNLEDSEQDIDLINKIKTWHQRSKFFYQRPTPPDLQFEEKQTKQNHYTNDAIYSWNIDGLSEHEIFVVLCQMQIAATAYLTDGDDHNVVHLILAGFTGTLKFWWENFLTDKERFYVYKSVNDDGDQDEVLRLMYAITKHFIGDPKAFKEKNSEILQNLKCRILSDFKWYHDVFLAKVMTREDCWSFFLEREIPLWTSKGS